MAEIEIQGLAKLRRALREIDPQLTKDLGNELRTVARDVADDARARVPSRSGRARASIRGGASGNQAYVSGGKRTVPYYGWLDFGARTPVSGRPRSVGPWKSSGAGPSRGRFIYPAIDAKRADIEREAAKAVEKIAERLMP